MQAAIGVRQMRTPVGVKGDFLEAPAGIEPAESLLRSLEPKVRLYVDHFVALRARGEL